MQTRFYPLTRKSDQRIRVKHYGRNYRRALCYLKICLLQTSEMRKHDDITIDNLIVFLRFLAVAYVED